MELLFNELSIAVPYADKYLAKDIMKQFVEAVKAARPKGFRKIRSHYGSNQIKLADNYSLYDWLNDKNVPEEYRNTLYGMITLPFIKKEDEEIEDQYIEANYYFESKEDFIEKTACLGLASAYLYETLCISLSTKPVWNKYKLSIVIEKEGVVSTSDVFNIVSKASFDVQEISEFVENMGVIILNETTLLPNDKKIHLADHHGVAELQTLCDRLKHSPYVIEMRSTDWGGRKFIRKIQKEGVIEIVLFKTQRQYALRVQTTGRNIRETKAIAELLDEKYS
jgi:hypothetical protein